MSGRTHAVDCLDNGAPHAAQARAFLDLFAALPPGQGDFVRCYTARSLDLGTRKLRERDFEIAEFGALLDRCVESGQRLLAEEAALSDLLTTREAWERPDVEAATQEHYGRLFAGFSEHDYYEVSPRILGERLAKNGVSFDAPEAKVALDAGCGGGRFTLALRRMGFRHVTGVDFSELNVRTATERRDARGVDGVDYRLGDVGALPFDDASFDFVFCMGVLHHTTHGFAAGVRELHRVLRPGGELFVAVMERPGGILFDAIELLREIMADVPLSFAMQALQTLGVAGFRLYSLLDHVMVPINVRSTPEEVEAAIEAAGFSSHRRMTRGLPSDQIERLHALGGRDPDAIWKYGVGENRYLCRR